MGCRMGEGEGVGVSEEVKEKSGGRRVGVF